MSLEEFLRFDTAVDDAVFVPVLGTLTALFSAHGEPVDLQDSVYAACLHLISVHVVPVGAVGGREDVHAQRFVVHGVRVGPGAYGGTELLEGLVVGGGTQLDFVRGLYVELCPDRCFWHPGTVSDLWVWNRLVGGSRFPDPGGSGDPNLDPSVFAGQDGYFSLVGHWVIKIMLLLCKRD